MHSWIPSFGISWHLGVDGISLFLVVLTGVLFPIAFLGADPHHDDRQYYAWLLLLEAGLPRRVPGARPVPVLRDVRDRARADVLPHRRVGLRQPGVRRAQVLPLHDVRLGVHARRASWRWRSCTSGAWAATSPSTSSTSRRTLASRRRRRGGCSSAFAIAFAVKVPLFPVHTWLPDAHTEAPTAGSVILAGVMLKLGTYGFLRFGLYLFPEATYYFAPMMVTLGVIGIIYGAVVATMQKDLKRLVAYSSVAHLGFIVLGTFALTTQGIQGGVLQMVNHGLSTGRAVPPRRDDLRAPAHARDRQAEGAAEVGAGAGRRVHARDALVDRAAGAQRVRRRVPHPRRVVPHPPVVDGGGRRRRDPRRRCTCCGRTSACSTASPTRTTRTFATCASARRW